MGWPCLKSLPLPSPPPPPPPPPNRRILPPSVQPVTIARAEIGASRSTIFYCIASCVVLVYIDYVVELVTVAMDTKTLDTM